MSLCASSSPVFSGACARQLVRPTAHGSMSASVKGSRSRRCEARAGTLVGVEFRQDKLARALGRLPTRAGVRADAGMLPLFDRSADVVTCLEVLEHLAEPERAVEELARICCRLCVVSVPWEPFFRLGNLCRGKDINGWGNNPEHIQHFGPSRAPQAHAPVLRRRDRAQVLPLADRRRHVFLKGRCGCHLCSRDVHGCAEVSWWARLSLG